MAIWALVVFGAHKYAERLFLVLSLVFFAYPVAAFLSRPNYAQAGAQLIFPHFLASHTFLFLVVALIGTTVTPYMQFTWPPRSPTAGSARPKGRGHDLRRHDLRLVVDRARAGHTQRPRHLHLTSAATVRGSAVPDR